MVREMCWSLAKLVDLSTWEEAPQLVAVHSWPSIRALTGVICGQRFPAALPRMESLRIQTPATFLSRVASLAQLTLAAVRSRLSTAEVFSWLLMVLPATGSGIKR